MEFEFMQESKTLVITPTAQIDHHLSEKIRRKADYEIQRHMPKKVVLDFTKINFMDSSGIGLIIGRYKTVHMLGGELEIENACGNVKRVLEMSGISKIIKIINNEEEINEKCM